MRLIELLKHDSMDLCRSLCRLGGRWFLRVSQLWEPVLQA